MQMSLMLRMRVLQAVPHLTYPTLSQSTDSLVISTHVLKLVLNNFSKSKRFRQTLNKN